MKLLLTLILVFSSVPSWASDSLKVAMLQINPIVGDFNGTVKQILEAYNKAVAAGADLAVTPEGVLPGYPAWDLVANDHFIERADQAVEVLQKATVGKKTALVVGHITFNPEQKGRRLQNVGSVLSDGKMIFRQAKMLLPTYDVFDDARYFEPSKTTKIFNYKGFRIGLRICEDWWYGDKHGERSIYQKDPIDHFRKHGIDVGISLSVSPYYMSKGPLRENVHAEVARSLGAPLIYVNSVGGIDQIQMDGASFVADGSGQISGRLKAFQSDFDIVEVNKDKNVEPRFLGSIDRRAPALPDQELRLQAITQGLREYMQRTGQKKVAFGFSGGLDSGVNAAVAVLALGAENVIAILMPSEYSSEGSITDALASARNLGIPEGNIVILPIKEVFDAQVKVLREGLAKSNIPLEGPNYVPYENIQARNRMIFELFVSNSLSQTIKINTSNKSEISMGYSSMYGDSTGALSPLGDLYKTEVRELGFYINQRQGREMVPVSTLTKAPSAELRPGQITANELPPYDQLDFVLKDLIENGLSLEQLKAKHTARLQATHGPDWVERVVRTFQNAEWKRNQAPPIIKVSRKTFGSLAGRRVPVTARQYDNVQVFRCEKIYR